MRIRSITVLCALFVLVVLSACSGGGGSKHTDDMTGMNMTGQQAPADNAQTSGAGQPADAGAADKTDAAQSDVKTYHIDIKDYSFGKGPLTVEAGSKIVFTNYDDVKHNAVAVDGSFSAPLLAKGDSYTVTLDKPGTYDYYCEPHKSFMTGQIIVK